MDLNGRIDKSKLLNINPPILPLSGHFYNPVNILLIYSFYGKI